MSAGEQSINEKPLSQDPSPDRPARTAAASRQVADPEDKETSTLLLLLMAGLGGTLPTVSRLAAFYVSKPEADLPEVGLYFGLLGFFIIGCVICFAMAERNPRRAVFVGIAAPAIITNASAGLDEASTSRTAPAMNQVTQHTLTIPFGYALYIDRSNFIVPAVAQRLYSKNVLVQEFVEEITIEAERPGDIRGSLNTDLIFVYAALSDGGWKDKPVADVAVGNAIRYLPAPGTRALGFVAGEVTAAIDLEPGFIGRVCLELDTSSRSDFLWALGFRRSTVITGIIPRLTDQDSCSSYFRSENRSRSATAQGSALARTAQHRTGATKVPGARYMANSSATTAAF